MDLNQILSKETKFKLLKLLEKEYIDPMEAYDMFYRYLHGSYAELIKFLDGD